MLDFIAVSQAIFLGKLFQGEIWLDIDLIMLKKLRFGWTLGVFDSLSDSIQCLNFAKK